MCISASTRRSFLPRRPPGCSAAKSSSLNPRRSSKAIASASPIASAAAVEAVGARFSEHASSFTAMSSTMSLADASVERGCAVSVMRGMPRRFTASSSSISSSVSPLEEIASKHVAGRQHAEIAVQRFGGVQEQRRRAGARKGCGDFAADQPGLAKSGDDDASFARVQKLDGLFEALVETVDQACNGVGFDLQDALGGLRWR